MSREAVQRALIEDSLFREPLWHGSNRSLAELLPDAPGHSEYGIYLTPRRRYAKQYGKHLYAVRAHVTNPLVVEGKYEISPGDLRHSDIERLKSRGYDAVVVGSLHDASEVVLFDPEQAEILFEAK